MSRGEVARRCLAAMRAENPKPVVVASVHHTGTVTTIEWLLWNSALRSMIEFNDLLGGHVLGPLDFTHFHVTGSGLVDSRGEAVVPREEVWAVIRDCRTVVPLRDPMLAILSRHARHPGADHSFIVNGFLAMADWHLAGVRPRRYAPIDLPETEEQRRALIHDVYYRLDLPVEPVIFRLARDWAAHNTWGDHELKLLYRQGDLEGIRLRMPRVYDKLVAAGPRIAPLLKHAGYPRPPWISGEAWEGACSTIW